MMEKDIDLVLDLAAQGGAELPVAATLKGLLQDAAGRGLAEKDFMALYLRLKDTKAGAHPRGTVTPTTNIASRGATMAVDWEQRVDFARLRRHRLARAKAALQASDLGCLLLFDPNNLRYVTSTAIGTWERDKNIRFALRVARRRPDPVGLRLGRAPPPAVLPVAPRVELAGLGAADARGDARRDGRPGRAGRDDLRASCGSAASRASRVGMDVPDMTTLLALQRRGSRSPTRSR